MKDNKVIIDVRFSDIDSMMIAHNSKYYIWFEIGRFAFSKFIFEFEIEELTQNYRLPVVKSNCKYLQAIHFADILTVKTYMYFNGSAKLNFYYIILNQKNIVCAIGSTQHTMIDKNNKLILKFNQYLLDKFTSAQIRYPDYFLSEKQAVKLENRINR